MSNTVCGGFTPEEITGEEGEKLRKNYFMYGDGVIRLLPTKWVLPKAFLKYANLIYDFQVRPDDICINTFPKSGTTWMQEIVWNLVKNPDLDNPEAKIPLDARVPSYEGDMHVDCTGAPPLDPDGKLTKLLKELYPDEQPSKGVLIHLTAKIPSPRFFKNHLPLSLLSKDVFEKGKVVYVARDPRDVLVSFLYFHRLHILFGYKGNMDGFLDDFINDRVIFSPYWEHMKNAWEKRNHPNLLFIYYEDMKEDIMRELKKINKFLGTNRNDQQLKNVAKRTSFTEMKERTSKYPPTSHNGKYFDKIVEKKGGGFFRKGVVGDWKTQLTPVQQEKINGWMAKNLPRFGKDFRYKV